jgi:hypothetical protein
MEGVVVRVSPEYPSQGTRLSFLLFLHSLSGSDLYLLSLKTPEIKNSKGKCLGVHSQLTDGTPMRTHTSTSLWLCTKSHAGQQRNYGIQSFSGAVRPLWLCLIRKHLTGVSPFTCHSPAITFASSQLVPDNGVTRTNHMVSSGDPSGP